MKRNSLWNSKQLGEGRGKDETRSSRFFHRRVIFNLEKKADCFVRKSLNLIKREFVERSKVDCCPEDLLVFFFCSPPVSLAFDKW